MTTWYLIWLDLPRVFAESWGGPCFVGPHDDNSVRWTVPLAVVDNERLAGLISEAIEIHFCTEVVGAKCFFNPEADYEPSEWLRLLAYIAEAEAIENDPELSARWLHTMPHRAVQQARYMIAARGFLSPDQVRASIRCDGDSATVTVHQSSALGRRDGQWTPPMSKEEVARRIGGENARWRKVASMFPEAAIAPLKEGGRLSQFRVDHLDETTRRKLLS